MKQKTTETRGVLTAIAALALAVVLIAAGCRVDGPDHGGIDPLGPLYTVTFDAAGESVSPPALTVHHGSPLAFLPANPTRTGNDFGGWYTKPNGGGTKFEAETPVTAPITVYAWWTATVTFEGNGGIPAKQTRTVTSGSLLDPLPEEPTREEHEFDHWNTLPDGKGQAFTRQILVTAHIPVYAKWLIDPYRVTFDAAGGSVSPQSQAVARGNSLNDSHLLPTPEKEKNTFDGWYTAEKGGGEKFTADTPVTADIIIYAKWLATVTFNTDGGSAAPDPVTVTSGTTLGSKMPSNPTRTGHTFGGWYTEKDGGDPFIASTEVTADITVYARWIINQYTVTFNAAGGSPDTQTVTVNYNTPLGALLPVPTKDGYTFGGWYTAANGSDDRFTNTTLVTANITVYAWWIHTVTFNAAGGTPDTQTRTVNHGSQIGDLPVPTRPGYTFDGWFLNENGTGDPLTKTTLVTVNITVYAWWIHTITFNAAGGSVSPSSLKVNHGSQIGDLPTPTKAGYTFNGWYTAANGGGEKFTAETQVTVDRTVYAWWIHTITFNAAGGTPDTQTRTVNYNTPLGSNMPPNPTKAGYTFGGWFPNPDGSGEKFTAETRVTANRTVYAWWIHTVTFDAAGGTPDTQTRTVNHGSQIDDLPTPTKTGDIFGGWFTARNGGGDRFTNTTPVTADIKVYAWWIHTVTFNTDEGSAAPQPVTVTSGTTLGSKMPTTKPTKNKYRFGGWYTAANGGGTEFKADTPVTADRTVYAKWTIDADSLPAVIDWINLNAVERGNYTYTLTRNETVTSTVFNQKKVNITLEGDSTERIVDFSNTAGDFFAVDHGVTLTLGNNLTLRGRNNSHKSLIVVCAGANLVMNAGSKICDNKISSGGSRGGGIYLAGAFTMKGGTITNNSAGYGGGIYLIGAFTMNGGEIRGNTAISDGGGVFGDGGKRFTKTGGTISNNIPNDAVP